MCRETLPLSVNGIESLVYTVDVQVGAQRFNLTLDTNAQALSKSFKVTAQSVVGRYLNEYPYVGLECHQNVGSRLYLQGVWGKDTYQFGAFSVPEVPFILSNHTAYPLNPRWASDGVFPLGYAYGEALAEVFSYSDGGLEVSLVLDK